MMEIIIYKNEKFEKLEEITLTVKDLDELILLKDFIDETIQDIKKDDYFEHNHFLDFLENKKIKKSFPDIIIYNKR